ncbi:hypothetical protein QEN19_002552 [Hanseniaspora menglaensis]
MQAVPYSDSIHFPSLMPQASVCGYFGANPYFYSDQREVFRRADAPAAVDQISETSLSKQNSSLLASSRFFQQPADKNDPSKNPNARKVFAKYWSSDGVFYYCMKINNVHVCRRSNDSYVNGTKLLNAANLTRGRRDGLLKKASNKFIVRSGIAALRGVWIPLALAQQYAKSENIEDVSFPLLENDLEVAFKNNTQFLDAAKKNMKHSASISSGSTPMTPLQNNSHQRMVLSKVNGISSPKSEIFKAERRMGDKVSDLNLSERNMQPTPIDKKLPSSFFPQSGPHRDLEPLVNKFAISPLYQPKPIKMVECDQVSNNEEDYNSNCYKYTNEPFISMPYNSYEVNPHFIGIHSGVPIPYVPSAVSWNYRHNTLVDIKQGKDFKEIEHCFKSPVRQPYNGVSPQNNCQFYPRNMHVHNYSNSN